MLARFVTTVIGLLGVLCVVLAAAASAHAAEFITTPEGFQIKVPTSKLPEPEPSALQGERCYGVARQGDEKGLTLPDDYPNPTRYRPQDGDGFAWIDLPFGICERLVSGSLGPIDNTSDLIEETLQRIRSESDDGTAIEGAQDLIEERINNFLYE